VIEFDWSVAMRRFLLAVVMCGAMSCAQAADLPVLRGGFTDGLTTTNVNWEGFYVGGQAGYGSSNENFNGTNQAMTHTMLANTVIEQDLAVSQWGLNLGKASQHASAYGAFAGHNWQWDDVVLGVETSYVHGPFSGSSSASIRRFFGSPLSDNFYHDITSSSTDSMSISDLATFRGRAGWAYGSFLPYAFGGFALGNADISRSVSVIDMYGTTRPPYAAPSITCANAGPPFCFRPTLTYDQPNHLVYGYTAGLGVDIHLIGGLFMRAEWEYVRITAAIDTSVNTVRAGLGYKF
jgi:outer membrane immunogenic protein